MEDADVLAMLNLHAPEVELHEEEDAEGGCESLSAGVEVKERWEGSRMRARAERLGSRGI